MFSGAKLLRLAGLFALFLAVFFVISLLSYSPAVDPPASTVDGIQNAGGKMGAYLSHYSHQSLGPVVWILAGWCVFSSIGLLLGRWDFLNLKSLSGWFLVLVGLSGFYSWLRPSTSYFIPSYLMNRSRPLFGPAGSFLMFTFLTVVGAAMNPFENLIDLYRNVYEKITTVVKTFKTRNKKLFRSFIYPIKLVASLPKKIPALPGITNGESRKKSIDSTDDSDGQRSLSESNLAETESDEQDDAESDDDESDKDTGENRNENQSDKVIPFEQKNETESEDETEKSGDSSQSPEETEKESSSDPIEVSHERPEVDEADMSKYRLPKLDLLEEGEIKQTIPDQETLDKTAEKLEETFRDFDLEGEVVDANPGPVLTMYEVEPGAGVSVKKFDSRADDIKLNLAVESVRIVSPIPGKSALGIEVPNENRALVRLRDVLTSDEFQSEDRNLPLALGLDVLGNPLVIDLASLPHLLVAGATGSGKSVCLNSIICSLIEKLPPDELKFIMIDPKRVELKLYDGLPHLMTPVIDDTSEATKVLKWAVKEMENRYEILSDAGMRDIDSYNEKVAGKDGKEKLPYLVIIVDELSDLMLTNPKECEQAITRLAQMARAVGIHMVLATQRPSTDVITGLIKANMPARLAFRVSSGTDSRVILDENGAETLLGNGDLLYLSSDSPHPKRGQGSFLSDEETKDLIKFTKEQVKPSYVEKDDLFGSSKSGNFDETMDDEYYEDAKKLVVERQKASASMLQRRFRVGYNRAARMIDAMEEEGVVGPHRGSKARNVMVDADEYFEEDGE